MCCATIAAGAGACTHRLADVLQDADFVERLLEEPLLVADDLDGDGVAVLAIDRADNLAKGAASELVDDLEPVIEVVVAHQLELAVLVVVAWRPRVPSDDVCTYVLANMGTSAVAATARARTVVVGRPWHAFDLGGALAVVPNFREVQHLGMLKRRELVRQLP